MRAVMGDITDPNVEQVVLMYAAQLGKSEILLNTLPRQDQHHSGGRMQ